MKRRDLERRLRIAGCFLKREGGNHSIWMNPKNGIIEAVPRHYEIKDPGEEDSKTARCRLKPPFVRLRESITSSADALR